MKSVTDSKIEAGVKVKICGITREEDALLASHWGAWAVGFVMAAGSPRRIEPEAAGKIVEKIKKNSRTQLEKYVAVIQDPTLDEISRILSASRVNALQLHGDEAPKLVKEIKKEFPKIFVIKALRPRTNEDLKSYSNFECDAFLIDTYSRSGLKGGTGETGDWRLARDFKKTVDVPVFLAGGLASANVTAALEAARPDGIDVSSSLESSPGIKDSEKVKKFFEAVKK